MSDCIITRRGGGIAFAQIAVNYPEGSVCTCASGSRTLTAKNTGGRWVFQVPSAGTWTVTSTYGSDSDSKSVSITAKDQVEILELSYAYYLIQNGTKKVQFTTVNATLVEQSGTAVFDTVNGGEFYASVNVSEYSTLSIQYSYLTAVTAIEMGVFTSAGSTQYDSSVELPQTQSQVKTITLDVSSYSGLIYVGAAAVRGGTANITEMKLIK